MIYEHGLVISPKTLKLIALCGKASIIPAAWFSFYGLMHMIQEGGAQKGSEVWGSAAMLYCAGWVGYYALKGLFK